MQTGALMVFLLQQKPAVFQQAGHFWHLLLSGPALQIVLEMKKQHLHKQVKGSQVCITGCFDCGFSKILSHSRYF